MRGSAFEFEFESDFGQYARVLCPAQVHSLHNKQRSKALASGTGV